MKIIKGIRNILFVIAIIILILAGILFLFDLKPAVVMSGSMEPTYSVGSLVLVDRKSTDNVKVGDPVAFNIEGNYIMHRIVEKNEGKFITKGDFNKTKDPWRVSKNQIDGKIALGIPYVGYAFNFLSSKKGVISMLVIGICLIISSFLDDRFDNDGYVPKRAKK